MSPGLTERAAREVLGRAHDRDHVHRQLQARDRPDRLQHAGGAGHVELHLGHLRRGLQRDPAAVEGHALAHQAEHRPARAGAAVAHGDQRGLLVGALGDRREGAHSPLEDPVAALDLGARPLQITLASALAARPARGGEVVGGAVLQVAGAVDRLGHHRRLGDGPLELPVARDDQRLELVGARPHRPRARAPLAGRSGSRPARCPPRGRPRSRAAAPSREHPAEVRVESSRARPPAAAAATRARSASKRSRLRGPRSASAGRRRGPAPAPPGRSAPRASPAAR